MFANRFYGVVGGLMLRIFSPLSRFGAGILFRTRVLNRTLSALPRKQHFSSLPRSMTSRPLCPFLQRR
jgi:hypothetical protein